MVPVKQHPAIFRFPPLLARPFTERMNCHRNLRGGAWDKSRGGREYSHETEHQQIWRAIHVRKGALRAHNDPFCELQFRFRNSVHGTPSRAECSCTDGIGVDLGPDHRSDQRCRARRGSRNQECGHGCHAGDKDESRRLLFAAHVVTRKLLDKCTQATVPDRLDFLARAIAERKSFVLLTGRSELRHTTLNRVLGYARHANGGPDGVTFYGGCYKRLLPGWAPCVHGEDMM
jgi:hypothetical protein